MNFLSSLCSNVQAPKLFCLTSRDPGCIGVCNHATLLTFVTLTLVFTRSNSLRLNFPSSPSHAHHLHVLIHKRPALNAVLLLGHALHWVSAEGPAHCVGACGSNRLSHFSTELRPLLLASLAPWACAVLEVFC
jgi:hypothetical protein